MTSPALPEPGALEVLNVVNIRRPLASTLDKVLPPAGGHADCIRTPAHHRYDQQHQPLHHDQCRRPLGRLPELLREVADRTGIPVAYTTGKKEFLDGIPCPESRDPAYVGTPVPIDVYMHRDWDSYIASTGINTVESKPGDVLIYFYFVHNPR